MRNIRNDETYSENLLVIEDNRVQLRGIVDLDIIFFVKQLRPNFLKCFRHFTLEVVKLSTDPWDVSNKLFKHN